jgi:hypothetical protein
VELLPKLCGHLSFTLLYRIVFPTHCIWEILLTYGYAIDSFLLYVRTHASESSSVDPRLEVSVPHVHENTDKNSAVNSHHLHNPEGRTVYTLQLSHEM